MNISIVEEKDTAAQFLDDIILKFQSENGINTLFENLENVEKYISLNGVPSFIYIDLSNIQKIDYDYIELLSIKCPVVVQLNKVGVNHQQKTEEISSGNSQKSYSRNMVANDGAVLLESSNTIEVIQKESFLVFKGNKYITVKTQEIAYFYINYKTPSIVTFKGEEFTLNYSLEKVHKMLSSKVFFRLNRQYLINFNAVKEVEHYFGRKLHVKLVVTTPERLLIGKTRSSHFLKWLEER